MKKLKLISLIVLVPIIIGAILLIVGLTTDNDTLVYTGSLVLSIGVPAVMIPLVVIGLILIITGKWSFDDKKNTKSDKMPNQPLDKTPEKTAADERNDIKEMNSSYGYTNWEKRAKYESENVAKIYKHSGLGDKIKTWLLFGFLIADFVLIFVFAFLDIMLGAIICFCLFAGTILLCFIVKTILEKISQSKKCDPLKYQLKTGVVQATLFSSATSWGSKNTQHISSTTYRVLIEVDNKTYNAYSKDFYDEGEAVEVWVRRDGKGKAKIKGRVNNDKQT